jgi:uncharacterized repeat protein (TIGR03803 family)
VRLLLASLGLLLTGPALAQTFTTLHNFSALSSGTNSDGATPYYVGLVLSGNTFYGTTAQGGTNGTGTVFGLDTKPGGTLNTLYAFTASATNLSGLFTNTDGADPNAGLLLAGGTLYGTATYGGTNGSGTLFALNTNGSGFTTLHTFAALVAGTNADGVNPICNLTLVGNTLFGTTSAGGTNGSGTVFAVNTNGTGFAVLHTFAVTSNNFLGFYTNSDGSGPNALIAAGNILYGTTYSGTTNGDGNVFAIDTDGTGFTILHAFTVSDSTTNSDGANPVGSLILTGSTLYGTAQNGGTNGNGTVFAIDTSNTGFATVYSFTATIGANYINNDGANPQAGLVLSGTTLYGTAYYGGTNGYGTIFSVETNGTAFSTLHTFATPSNSTNADGINPNGSLFLLGSTLFGTVSAGGLYGNGTIFSLAYPAPSLAIKPAGTNVELMWPSGVVGFSYSGYALESATNLNSPVWKIVPSVPGQFVVTNPVSGSGQFYRLRE